MDGAADFKGVNDGFTLIQPVITGEHLESIQVHTDFGAQFADFNVLGKYGSASDFQRYRTERIYGDTASQRRGIQSKQIEKKSAADVQIPGKPIVLYNRYGQARTEILQLSGIIAPDPILQIRTNQSTEFPIDSAMVSAVTLP